MIPIGIIFLFYKSLNNFDHILIELANIPQILSLIVFLVCGFLISENVLKIIRIRLKYNTFNIVKLIQHTSKEDWSEIKKLYLRVFLLTLLLITLEILVIAVGGYLIHQ